VKFWLVVAKSCVTRSAANAARGTSERCFVKRYGDDASAHCFLQQYGGDDEVERRLEARAFAEPDRSAMSMVATGEAPIVGARSAQIVSSTAAPNASPSPSCPTIAIAVRNPKNRAAIANQRRPQAASKRRREDNPYAAI
jgi:hypothetical protein